VRARACARAWTFRAIVAGWDCAFRWIERRRSAGDGPGVDEGDDAVTACVAKNARSSRASMNTALPQCVQNERLGSHRRRHEPQIIGRCYANFCHIQDFLADDGLVRQARRDNRCETTKH
jgi:hypothetical protein